MPIAALKPSTKLKNLFKEPTLEDLTLYALEMEAGATAEMLYLKDVYDFPNPATAPDGFTQILFTAGFMLTLPALTYLSKTAYGMLKNKSH